MCTLKRITILSTLVTLIKSELAQMEGFVIGGDYVSIAKYPHSAYLAVECQNPGKAFESWACGSSILNQRLLLTAAHCVDDCTPRRRTRITVSVGNENRKNSKTILASKFVMHPDYKSSTLENDIALVKLMKPLNFNANVKKVVVMKKPPYREGASVAGWGITNDNTKIASIYLKEVQQSLLHREECVDLFGSHMYKGTMCAQYKSKTKKDGFAAEGDSGSALVTRGYIQIGLVSFKMPTVSNDLVVYTDVAFFYEWIKIVSKALYCSK